MTGPEVDKINRPTFFQRNFSSTIGKVSGRILLGKDLNRGRLLGEIRLVTSSVQPTALEESRIIRILESERVIKPEFRGVFDSINELSEAHLTLLLTPEKLRDVSNAFSSAVSVDLTAAFSPFESGTAITGLPRKVADKITDKIWDIRESRYNAEASIVRMQALTAVMIRAAEGVSGNTINPKEMSPEMGHSVEMFFARTTELADAMRTDSNAILQDLQRNGYFARERSISDREKLAYRGISNLLNNLNSPDASTRLLELCDNLRNIPEIKSKNNKRLLQVLDSLHTIAKLTNDSRTKTINTDELTLAYAKLTRDINHLLKHGDIKNWPLRLWATSAIAISAAYIGYRIVSNFGMQEGYNLPSYIAATALIAAEAFCNYSSIVNNIGVLHALIKTKGAHGQSWIAKGRTQLERDPWKREGAALFLSSMNEPVKPLLDSTKAAIRAVWNYGKASLKVLDDSAFSLYFYFGITASVRWVRRMSAVKEALTQIATLSGISDMVKCHEISTDLASLSTELDDPETSRFAVLRVAQDATRNHGIYEKKVVALANQVYAQYERTGGLITEAYVAQEALNLKISEAKVVAIAREVFAKLTSLRRKSEIAALGKKLLEEEKLEPEERQRLAELLKDEHAITIEEAKAIVYNMQKFSRNLYLLSKMITDEIDFQGTPERRSVFYAVHQLMEKIMQFDERENAIEAHLGNKCRQIIEWVTPLRGKISSKLGDAIAAKIDALPRTTDAIETRLQSNANMTYEQASREIWVEKSNLIGDQIIIPGARVNGIEGETAKALVDKIIDELSANREERFSATFELSQYLANKLLSGKTSEQAVSDLDTEKLYIGQRKPKDTGWMKDGLLEVAKQMATLTLVRVADPGISVADRSLDTVLIKARTMEYAEMVHRDRALKSFPKENSGKAGAINNAIHGLTSDEMVAEMLRQTIHRHIEERYAKQNKIPEALETDLDRTVSDLVPEQKREEANPRKLARNILARISSGETPEAATTNMLALLQIPAESREEARQNILRVAREMQARVTLYDFLVELSKNPQASAVSILNSLQRFRKLDSKERKVLSSLAGAISKGLSQGNFKFPDDLSQGISLRAHEDKPHTDPSRVLCEQVNHLLIVPEGRSIGQIVDSMIAIRRLPTALARSKKDGKFTEFLAPELRSFVPKLETFFGNYAHEISRRIAAEESPEAVAEDLIQKAKTEVLYDVEKKHVYRDKKTTVVSPFEQMLPQMSSLRYRVIGCFDADYRINPEALHEMMPYFKDHPDYFFLGKRQYGRNWPNNHMARVMQNAHDGFWGFQNIASSLANNVASWGSCVFHSTEAYVESSHWVTQKRNYGLLWNIGINKVNGKNMLFGKIELPNNFRWYQLWDSTAKDPATGLTVGAWTDARKFTPLRVINAAQRFSEIVLGIEGMQNGTKKGLATLANSIPFSALKVAALPFHIPYVLFGAPLRNALHERGARGKSGLNWERRNDQVIDMLASQDHTTESEDIASCMHELRKMPYLSGNGAIRAYLQTRSVDATGRLSAIGNGRPHERSGYVEGIGGLGSHAEDFRAYYATDLTRWRRGNLDLLAEMGDTPMTLWAKMRYKLLAQNWTLGLLRLSFMTMPTVFAFTGVDPVISNNLKFLGIMAFGNFFLNMGSYFANMSSRGHGFSDSLRAMLIDYYYLVTKAKSVVDGFFIRERAAFVVSPKKTVVPLKATLSQLSWDISISTANLAAAVYSTYFAVNTLQPELIDNIPKFFVPFWSLFNASLITAASLYMNKGARQNNKNEIDRTFSASKPDMPSEEGR